MLANHTYFGVIGLFFSSIFFAAGFFGDDVLSIKSSLDFEVSTVSVAVISDSSTPTNLLFLGDILLARNVEFLMTEFGADYPWKNIASTLQLYDSVVGNFESAMADPHVRTKSLVMQFSTPTTSLTSLTASGVSHLSLANNHAYDYGLSGYANAKTNLYEAHLTSFGNPDILSIGDSVTFIDVNNVRIAVIGIHAVFSLPSSSELKTLLTSVENISDMQIVYIHWGSEYVLSHNNAQENLAKLLVQNGVDAIVGHHPHVTQDIQVIDGVPVFYSLGNFIFDQYFSTDVQEGYMLGFTPTKTEIEFEIIPITSIGTRSQPRLMNTEERSTFLHNLAKRSSLSLSKNIQAGKGIFNIRLATSTQTSMISE